jgi:Amt family ammonium transporter
MGLFTSLRVSEREEAVGMDVTQHGEEAYVTGEGAILVLPDKDDKILVADPG